MYFYQRLRDLREDADLTQAQVAAILGTSQRQYCRWELGQWQMPVEHYKTLAKYYNVSLDYLAGLTDTVRTLDGSRYRINKNITITQTGNGKINIKN